MITVMSGAFEGPQGPLVLWINGYFLIKCVIKSKVKQNDGFCRLNDELFHLFDLSDQFDNTGKIKNRNL